MSTGYILHKKDLAFKLLFAICFPLKTYDMNLILRKIFRAGLPARKQPFTKEVWRMALLYRRSPDIMNTGGAIVFVLRLPMQYSGLLKLKQ
jgi:hypothetical protein